jgi:hypothetical protein
MGQQLNKISKVKITEVKAATFYYTIINYILNIIKIFGVKNSLDKLFLLDPKLGDLTMAR